MGREVWRSIKIPWGPSKNIGHIKCPRIQNKVMLKEERRFKNLEKLRGKCWSKYDGCDTKNWVKISKTTYIYIYISPILGSKLMWLKSFGKESSMKENMNEKDLIGIPITLGPLVGVVN